MPDHVRASGREQFSIDSLGPATIDNPIRHNGPVNYVDEGQRLLLSPFLQSRAGQPSDRGYTQSLELAGPRRRIYFDPRDTRAALVSCGGLCPGINAVIRGIVLQLWHLYECRDIVGIPFGYQGLRKDAGDLQVLTPDAVRDIRSDGGTMLGSSRGSPPTREIVDSLQAMGIDMLFTIGGDGTMRGAGAIWQEVRRRGLDIAVVGVPKTIDNDIPYVYESFGFATAVAEASKAINSAEVEARGVPNGIGLVRLMGREAGYIAAAATLASGNANFCLIPEVPFSLQGPGGLLELVEQRLRSRNHAVIVVAEGAGQDLVGSRKNDRDASGNRLLGNVGHWLRDRIVDHFRARELEVALKYIDPSYMIRSAAPNTHDQQYCDRLARNAVHAAMAGKGGLLVGQWHGCLTHVPIRAMDDHRRQVNPEGETWFNVRENTGQPHVIGSPVCELG